MTYSSNFSRRTLQLAVLLFTVSSITMAGGKPASSSTEPALIGHMLVTATRLATAPSSAKATRYADLGHMTVTAPREQAVAQSGSRARPSVL